MIEVAKDAIMYKDSEGQMQSAGVLCNVEIQSGGEVFELERYCTMFRIPTLNVFGKRKVTLNLDNLTSFQMFCTLTENPRNEEKINTTVEELTLNCKKPITTMQQFLNGNSYHPDETLKKIILNADLSKSDNFQNSFSNTRALESIEGTPLDLTSATRVSSIFANCNALKDVGFAPRSIFLSISFSHSPELSDESIQSIIDGLADLTGQTAQTLTLHDDVKDEIRAEQRAQATAKNWNIA